METEYTLKRLKAGGWFAERILCVLCPQEEATPVLLIMMTIGTQKSCKLLVQSLYLTIRLWVVSRGETDVNVEVLAECGPNSGSELRATIRDNVLRESVETETCSTSISAVSRAVGSLFMGYEMACLGETINYHQDGGIVP